MKHKKYVHNIKFNTGFNARVMPDALRCVYCASAFFQAFQGDGVITTDENCLDCNGRGCAPIPPAEVGL